MLAPEIGSVLVVEDDRALLGRLEQLLRPLATQVHLCQDRRSAAAFLARQIPDLLLLDLSLPDGDAFDVLQVMQGRHPSPRIVAMSGVAGPQQSFRLAQLGVQVYLSKPFGGSELREAIKRALSFPVDILPHVRAAVGQQSLREVEAQVRQTMLQEALARAGGSRRAAARLLQVSRQLLQHILRKSERKGSASGDG